MYVQVCFFKDSGYPRLNEYEEDFPSASHWTNQPECYNGLKYSRQGGGLLVSKVMNTAAGKWVFVLGGLPRVCLAVLMSLLLTCSERSSLSVYVLDSYTESDARRSEGPRLVQRVLGNCSRCWESVCRLHAR